MAAFIYNVTFDALEPRALGRFWSDVTNYSVTEERDDFVMLRAPDERGIRRILFFRVDDPTPGKNKLHLDVHTDDDLDAEVARWTEAGATSLGKRSAGDFSWVTLTDPDGNEFCIAGS